MMIGKSPVSPVILSKGRVGHQLSQLGASVLHHAGQGPNPAPPAFKESEHTSVMLQRNDKSLSRVLISCWEVGEALDAIDRAKLTVTT